MAASLALFILAKTHADDIRAGRFATVNMLASVTTAIAKPADALRDAKAWIQDMIALRQENERLRQENAALMRRQSETEELGNENTRLRALMNFAPPNRKSYISARVALTSDGPFGHSAVVNAGSDERVQDDLAVIDDNGLVGRVLETGKKSSRILLLTDALSRIPVMSENSRERAIAAGTNENDLTLLYLSEKSAIKEGERIVTTSDGGVLPPGLPVGVVTKVEKGAITVRPFMDAHRLEYVSIVDFGL